MKFSRRDLLIGSAGACAGLVLTPVPWKLLGDTSIWTQNWPWIAQPPRGPVETKRTACTLCPAGCGMRVRLAGGWPVGVSGDKEHPVTKGALCPLAFAAQQLNWHPQRLREVRHRGLPSSWPEAQTAFTRACSEGPLLVVDGRPGRAASSALEAFARKQKGTYQVALSTESKALEPYARWSGLPISALGYDIENTRTIVSFGAPLLDGWGAPGRFTRLWSERAADTDDPRLRLIQVESSLSRTASRAWKWIAIRERSESAAAQGIARVLLEERLVKAGGPLPQMSLLEAGERTGLSVEAIRNLARTMIENLPALAIAADGNTSVAALNAVLGAVGAPGGIVLNQAAKPRTPSESTIVLPRVVLIDSSVPWDFEAGTGAEVFRFAAWDGGGNKADWLLPAPGFGEEISDVPTAPALAINTYAMAMNLTMAPPEVKGTTQFLREIDSELPDVENTIKTRCNKLFHAKQGTVYGEQAVKVAKFDSAQKIEEALRNGAVWVDAPRRNVSFRCELKQWPAEGAAASLARTWDSEWSPAVLPPLAAKLYQESTLRERPARRTA